MTSTIARMNAHPTFIVDMIGWHRQKMVTQKQSTE